MNPPSICRLQELANRVEACPGRACSFWEEGGAVLDGGCLFARLPLELERKPDLVDHLLELRFELDRFELDRGPSAEARRSWDLFYRLLGADV